MRHSMLPGPGRTGLRNRAVRASAALAVILIAGAAPVAVLKAEPDVLVFHRTDASVTTALTRDGRPLPAGEMGETKLWANGHDYDEMFRYDRSDGSLKLTPTEYCEVGSYDLVVKTPSGNLNLKVYTPLDEMAGTLDRVAASMGISVDELRKRMGLVTSLGRSELSISLPEVYYEGQAIELELDAIEGAVHTWKINGAVVAEGPDATRLFHVLDKPGLVVLEYHARRGEATVASTVARTMVAKLPPITWKVPKNVEFTLHATQGYGKYTWTVNGKAAAQGSALTHTFQEAGPATIACLCEEPASGPEGTFLRFTYDVTVTE